MSYDKAAWDEEFAILNTEHLRIKALPDTDPTRAPLYAGIVPRLIEYNRRAKLAQAAAMAEAAGGC
jgi:hypothetical protein